MSSLESIKAAMAATNALFATEAVGKRNYEAFDQIYTADARNAQNVKKAMMGFGAANVILDESPLIPDDLYATIKRMVGFPSNT